MAFRMKDIAERTGVSVTTVSHVINNTRPVAPETRRRVLDAVRGLKYVRDAHARRLACGSSDFFGMVISDIANPFFPEIIKSFETAAVARGFDLLLSATNYDRERTRAAVRNMVENKVRGVAVMTSHLAAEIAEELTAHQMPVVFFDDGPVRAYMSKIRVEYSIGCQQAVEHLIALGHRDFAFISGPPHRRSSTIYQNAVLAALGRHGRECAGIAESDLTVEGGAAAARELLRRGGLCTAILCQNDLSAIGALQALREEHRRVPEDMSVIGSDDIYFARVATPPLTTINLHRDELGKLAFEALEQILSTKRHRGKEIVVKTQLVVRQSTGAAAVPAGPLHWR